MGRAQSLVFVLWSNHFEEAPAALFVSEFRQVGLRVKVVGLRGFHAPGKYGLALTPDLTLGQALPLVNKVCCVVLPCAASQLVQMQNDPRLVTFLQKAAANQALLVLSEAGFVPINAAPPFWVDWSQVICYPAIEALVLFVREIANGLRQD